MMKWAIYKNEIGLYARRYIDDLSECREFPGGSSITADRLPIVANSAGGRCPFDPDDASFVEIIEKEDGEEPLTREQCFPRNSDAFRYGWIAPNGDTYNTGYTGHYRAAEMIRGELRGKACYGDPERELEEAGWIKISRPAPYTPDDKGETEIYTDGMKMTKRQADTLVDLGYSGNRRFQRLMRINEENW